MKAESQEFHSVTSYDRNNFLFKFVEENPRNVKIVRERNLPKAKSTSFAATATADPLEDPPGIRSGAHGFLGVP